jgi:hypothetical protein
MWQFNLTDNKIIHFIYTSLCFSFSVSLKKCGQTNVLSNYRGWDHFIFYILENMIKYDYEILIIECKSTVEFYLTI